VDNLLVARPWSVSSLLELSWNTCLSNQRALEEEGRYGTLSPKWISRACVGF
jgi:hypothetical protein